MTPTEIIDGLEHAKTHLLMFDGWSRKDIDAIRHAIAYIRTDQSSVDTRTELDGWPDDDWMMKL